MLSSELEDALEAILRRIPDAGNRISKDAMSETLPGDPARKDTLLSELRTHGYLSLEPDGQYMLSEAGRALGEKVILKHRTLECFLTEMLGMDAGKASEEACRLEHEVSDETITRLTTYIENPRLPCGRGGRRRAFRHAECGGMHTILDFPEGSMLKVLVVRGAGAYRRLLDLGIIPGEILELRRKLRNESIVVKVKGCDVALSPEIARGIVVELLP
jgi:DtxR family Mn-dependent transcriptional regulator